MKGFTSLKNSIFITTVAAASVFASSALAAPHKTEVELRTANLDTRKFLDHVEYHLNGRFRGYAVVFTGASGKRLGFRRQGWALVPGDSSTNGVPFTLDTETAIGSVTKLFTTALVLKSTHPSGASLDKPFTEYVPYRWQVNTHPFFKTVSVRELLQHRGGFRKTGNQHISQRLAGGREQTESDRFYSNTSMGIFHFIYARYTGNSTVEYAYKDHPIHVYNEKVQQHTAHAYNVGLHERICVPLQISVTANPYAKKFPNGRSQYFPMGPVAKSYSSPHDLEGRYLEDRTLGAAAGGLYMSAKDLAKFMSALNDPSFMPPSRLELMCNNGNSNHLLGFWASGGAEGGRCFVHNGARTESGHGSRAQVVRFQSGAHAIFVSNSPEGNIDIRKVLIDAYNKARKG